MTVFVCKHYEVQLIKQLDTCIEALIGAFEKSSLNACLKFYVMEIFIHNLKYAQVERFLNAIEKHVTADVSQTYLVTNVNPILTGTNIINILFIMSERYHVSEFRAQILIDMILGQCRKILVRLYLPTELKIMVRRKDLSNRNSLYYMELMDSFSLMDTKVMDRIMKEYWSSDIDTSGSFFQASTAYQLWNNKEEDEDEELNLRFYKPRDIKTYSAHPYTLRVYLKSMQTRYFIELALFLMLAILFQIQIGNFQGKFSSLKE